MEPSTPVANAEPSWRVVAIDGGIAALLAAAALPASVESVVNGSLPGVWPLALLTAVGVAHLAVAMRRVSPPIALGSVSLAMLVLVLGPDVAGEAARDAGGPFAPILLPSSLTFFFVLYAASAYRVSRWPSLGLAIGLVGWVLTVARLWEAPVAAASPLPGAGGWRLFVVVAVLGGVLAAWALGRYRATRIAWVAALEERAVRAEAERVAALERARLDLEAHTARATADERRRIAREMHDVVAHSLAVVVGQAEGGRLAAQKDPARAIEVLDTIGLTGRQALTEMRALLGVLRDQDDHPDGPREPQPGLAGIGALVERLRSAGTAVTVEHRGTPRSPAAVADLTAYRIVQEALTNVVNHAGPGASARVEFDWRTDALTLRVVDDGVGGASSRPTGRGLVGMRERLSLLGGTLKAGPGAGGGFSVEALIPLTDSRNGAD